MSWTSMTDDRSDWFDRLKTRFPYLDDSAAPVARQGRDRFETYLTETHNLTLTEAKEEIDDFLYLEFLIREADGDMAAA